MHKITPRASSDTIKVTTSAKSKITPQVNDWWNSGSKAELHEKFLSSVVSVRADADFRRRKYEIFATMYGGSPLFRNVRSPSVRSSSMSGGPAKNRPTMSVVTSGIDTLVSKLSMQRPRPVFLTDNGKYRQRNLAKKLSNFINGEFYRTNAYELGLKTLKDACVFGSGILKVLEGQDHKITLERRLPHELFVDPIDAFHGEPRQLYEQKYIARSVARSMFSGKGAMIDRLNSNFSEHVSGDSINVADQIVVYEGWHLPSGPDATDGMRVIACDEGVLFEEPWEKESFPFVVMDYSTELTGFFGWGVPYQIFGTQMEINSILKTITDSMNLVGVPRVFVEAGSKVLKAALNSSVGTIVEYRGTKPSYEVAPCVPVEMYGQLERLVTYAYQQIGISQLAANSQKPSGLNSGAALREYDDIQTDRFADLSRRYDQFYTKMAYQMIDLAKDIVKREGEYNTIFVDKAQGIQEISLEDYKALDDPYVIQCFNSSSLPREPAARLERVTEMMQAGLVSPQEGRRLLDFPDISQIDKLDSAAEERIYKVLDDIIETGDYTSPDQFMDLAQALKIATQYYNMYSVTDVEPDRLTQIERFITQVNDLAAAMTLPPPGTGQTGGEPAPIGQPIAPPVSDLMPVAS